jgi:glycosyltransferase involved in cell wall biosynthesis
VKILQIHTRYRQPGGEDTVVDAEAAVLRAAGHDVIAYEARNPESTTAAAASTAFSPWNPAVFLALRRAVDRINPDVAHVHNTWHAFSPSVFAALDDARVPVVMTLHNYRLLCANGQLFRDGHPCEDCVGGHPWQGVRHRCYRASLAMSAVAAGTIALNRRLGTWHRRVRMFLATTSFARGRFIAGGLPADRIRVKPHFVDDPGPRVAPPSASKEVLYVGRLSAEKGIGGLVDAFSHGLKRDGLRLVVAGDGPQRTALERRAGPAVRFVGRLDPEQVRQRMRSARALAFPSIWYETFGLSLLEAMSSGLPVVASDLGGTREIVGQQAGWLVPPGDPAAWSVALRRLDDPIAVDAAGGAARARWQEHYTAKVGLVQLEAAYRAVFADGGAVC